MKRYGSKEPPFYKLQAPVPTLIVAGTEDLITTATDCKRAYDKLYGTGAEVKYAEFPIGHTGATLDGAMDHCHYTIGYLKSLYF